MTVKRETVFVRGENGQVIEHDLPLPSGVQDRVDRGQLHLTDKDGVPLPEKADEKPAPRTAAKK